MLNSHCASGGLRKDESEDARRRKCKAAGVALKRAVSVSRCFAINMQIKFLLQAMI